ncbi:hypothetical protein BVG16_30680 [Paenibacillus selenitireducens]|uniref:CobW/HypB/UreG nucleotide-binding domain-containing protein n=2 Tax=Paenibacillus selenitireducens TaxID=1324314 RepID=A0A1T2WZY6_9BACL|nr:hypothetical protein BVG16_30680 [Paenibacillus selenitireducens]
MQSLLITRKREPELEGFNEYFAPTCVREHALLRLMEEVQQRGLKPGVLMNELGKQDVDGHLLEGYSKGALQKLLDGCVCCSKKSELAGSLKLRYDQKPDIILIELTGVANPEEITDALSEPNLVRSLDVKQIITVLDAEHTLDYNSIFASDRQLVHTLRRQIEVTHLIVLNKIDLAEENQLLKIEKMIRKQNERAQIVRTMQSRIDVGPIMDSMLLEKNTWKTRIPSCLIAPFVFQATRY